MHEQHVKKAELRLLGAKIALEELAAEQPYGVFQSRWFNFLMAWKGIYTQLEQASKANQASLDWFVQKKDERLADPLLRYLYEARNDDEHGLEEPTKLVPGSVSIGVSREGYSNRMVFNTNAYGQLVAESLDGLPLLTEIVSPHVTLSPVTARSGKTLDPPAFHLGLPVSDQSPLNVATLGFAYVARVVAEATAFKPA